MNDLLAALSAAHFGAFTAQDAYDCGYHRGSLSQLASKGGVLRVGPSAYVERSRYEAASPERRHEMATRAVVRTFGGRVLASHYSALTLMSLPVFGVPLANIHVARAADSQTRRRSGLTIHTAYRTSAARLIGRTPSVGPALAILGTAMVCGIETGVVAADAALAAGNTTVKDLQTWLARLSRHPDVTQARQAVRLADARSESVGESRARLLLNALGFRPTPQFEVRDRQGRLVGRVDFMLRHADDEPFLLEVNTSPGMTGHSLVPIAARSVGLSYEDLCVELLASARVKTRRAKLSDAWLHEPAAPAEDVDVG
jgi:hypothetical protein